MNSKATQTHPRRPGQCGGIVVMDTLIGLLMLGAMAAALLTAFMQHRIVEKTFAGQRDAVRALERAAFELQSGRLEFRQDETAAPGTSETFGYDGISIQMRKLDDGWIELLGATRHGWQYLYVRSPESDRRNDSVEVSR